jgi:hypothetical protein
VAKLEALRLTSGLPTRNTVTVLHKPQHHKAISKIFLAISTFTPHDTNTITSHPTPPISKGHQMKQILSLGAALCLLATLPAHAQPTAHIEFIDTGTPKNGTTLMTGWHGVIVRVVLDTGGPITRINLGGANGFGGGIGGAMSQRWTDPTGQSHYTQTSPGPFTANNTFGSDFNFDSHLLGTPEMYAASSSFAEAYHGSALTQRTGLPSDAFVGYLASPPVPQGADPIEYGIGVHLGGLLDINPTFQSSSIDAAYVVTDSGFQVSADVTGSAVGGFVLATFQLPDPGAWGLSFAAAVLALLRRRTNPTPNR